MAQVQLGDLVQRGHAALGPPVPASEADIEELEVRQIDHRLVLEVAAIDVGDHAVEQAGHVRAGGVDAVVPAFGPTATNPHVPVGQGQQGLAMAFLLRVETVEHELPRVV